MENLWNFLFFTGYLKKVKVRMVNLKRYIIKSNRETGKGRSDIIIKYPNRRGAANILELKVSKIFKEMSGKCDESLKQIEEKQYDKELLDFLQFFCFIDLCLSV